MTKKEIKDVRETLVELVGTVKDAIEKEPDSIMLLEGDFLILADIRNLLHLANIGQATKLTIMLEAYKNSLKRGDSLDDTIQILSDVIDRDRE